MLMEKYFLTAMKIFSKDEKVRVDYHCKYNEEKDEYEPEDESFYVIRFTDHDKMCDMEIHEDGNILCGYRDKKNYKILSPKSDEESIKLAANQMRQFMSGKIMYNELEQ